MGAKKDTKPLISLYTFYYDEILGFLEDNSLEMKRIVNEVEAERCAAGFHLFSFGTNRILLERVKGHVCNGSKA